MRRTILASLTVLVLTVPALALFPPTLALGSSTLHRLLLSRVVPGAARSQSASVPGTLLRHRYAAGSLSPQQAAVAAVVDRFDIALASGKGREARAELTKDFGSQCSACGGLLPRT